jgi:hypothetical protein
MLIASHEIIKQQFRDSMMSCLCPPSSGHKNANKEVFAHKQVHGDAGTAAYVAMSLSQNPYADIWWFQLYLSHFWNRFVVLLSQRDYPTKISLILKN